MEKSENKKYSKTSWIVFIFTISIVLISLVPVIFPALFSEILFKTELSQYDIPKSLRLLGKSENSVIAAIEHSEKHIVAYQFHPEVEHTKNGSDFLEYFFKPMLKENYKWI